jgi:hypothetical protein
MKFVSIFFCVPQCPLRGQIELHLLLNATNLADEFLFVEELGVFELLRPLLEARLIHAAKTIAGGGVPGGGKYVVLCCILN